MTLGIKISKRISPRKVSIPDMLNTVRDASEACQLIIFVQRSVVASASVAAGYSHAYL